MGHSLGRAARVSEWVFPAVPPTYDGTNTHLVYFPVEGAGTNAPAMLIGREFFSEEDMTKLGTLVSTCVIYFHSNGCDIGQCLEDMITFRDGALDGDAVVLAPEYPGYGLLREYEPSVSGINLLARAAHRYAVEGLGFRPAQVMLWGRSIGTGPATELAFHLAGEAQAAAAAAAAGNSRLAASAPPMAGAATGPSPPPRLGGDTGAGPDAGAGPENHHPCSRPPPVHPGEAQCGVDHGQSPPEDSQVRLPDSLPRTAGAYFASVIGEPEVIVEIAVGAEVVVKEPFCSDSEGRAQLNLGDKGVVLRLDDRGDALIDFEAHAKCQWIFKSNLGKLHVQYVEPAVGALVLLAPLISVSAVIQHHVPSRLAASLVGPMWEVLERVKDKQMEGIPLLIIHPKCDEIVPSSHGQAVFERASSRHKFGVWLCNATHNVSLDEDHLRIARNFLLEVKSRQPSTIVKPALDIRLQHVVALGTPLCHVTASKPPVTLQDVLEEDGGNDVAMELSVADEDADEVMRIAAKLMDLGMSGRAEEAVLMSL